jgi:acylphosphatase
LAPGTERLHIVLRGAVQGIGFRPTIYRIAQKLRLAGWVRDTEAGIEMEVEGDSKQLTSFLHRLKSDHRVRRSWQWKRLCASLPSRAPGSKYFPASKGKRLPRQRQVS